MQFPDPLTFFKALGITIGLLVIIIAIIGWLVFIGLKSYYPIKFFVKYKILRKGYKAKDVEDLLYFLQKSETPTNLHLKLLLDGFRPARARELIYIYKKMIEIENPKIVERRIKKHGRSKFNKTNE